MTLYDTPMKLYAVLIPQSEIAILVYEDGIASNRFADGIASNRFADGIVGVPRDWREEAEIAFDPHCDPVVGEE